MKFNFNKATLFTILGYVGTIAGMIFSGIATSEKNKETLAKEAAKFLSKKTN